MNPPYPTPPYPFALTIEPMMKQTRFPSAWTADELESLRRLRLAAAMHNPDAVMALGATEDGDPWCSIFSPQTGEVIINVARIAGDYIRMPGSNAAVRCDDLGTCVEAFLMLRPWRPGVDPRRRHS